MMNRSATPVKGLSFKELFIAGSPHSSLYYIVHFFLSLPHMFLSLSQMDPFLKEENATSCLKIRRRGVAWKM